VTRLRWVLAGLATLGVLLVLPEWAVTAVTIVSVIVAAACALILAARGPQPRDEDESWQRFTEGGWWR
jgi:hypothetical protein